MPGEVMKNICENYEQLRIHGKHLTKICEVGGCTHNPTSLTNRYF